MTAPWRMLSGVSAVAFCLGIAGTAWAQQDPNTGGQLNKCWGQIASQTAKLDTPEGTSGGGMGQHSRSTQAANLSGGFTADGNGFGITFNVKEDGGNAGREGVGNVSATDHDEPGDGGNGVHAIANADAATRLNPVTGQRTPALGGTAEVVDLSCDLP
jgi:hypothetical protein